MPQPVQPPEIPAIIQPATSEQAASLDESLNKTSASVPTRTPSIGVLATPTPPEIVAQSSSLEPQQGAALLGSPISIGYPIQPAGVPSSGEAQKQENIHLTTLELSPAERSGADPKRLTPFSPTPSSSQAVGREASSSYPLPSNADSLPSNTSNFSLGTEDVKRLVTQERGGESREFEFADPTPETQPLPNEEVAPTPEDGEAPSQPPVTPESETPVPATAPVSAGGVIELTADRQEYDEQRQVITAEGNVLLRFREALVDADRVQVNLPNRIVVAEGNVALTRGDQVLRGERFEYYFVQDSGVVLNAKGELYTPTSGTDLSILSPTGGTTATGSTRPVSDRIARNQPLQDVLNSGGYSFVVGAGRTGRNVATPDAGGTINRLRYEADRIDFDGKSSLATNVRITNDPFSPPELELRANTVRFTRLEPLLDEIVASKPRLVFDQGFSVPLLRNRITIDRREREPGLVNFGYDRGDRGGVYAERTFELLNTPSVRFSVTPQYFLQKALLDGGIIDPSVFGVKARLDANLSPSTRLVGSGVLTTLDSKRIDDELRASLRLQQTIGTRLPHTLNLEYSYRDRLFNGSLGFQTVQSSLGAILTSPVIPLGNTGINLTYQAGVQYINADTDRLDLLPPIRTNNRINLTRYQASASLSKFFLLWQGQALPATPTEGLRYTPTPVVPYLGLVASVTGVASAYSSSDSQETLSGTIGVSGELGHFSKPFLDYTAFNLSYTQVAINDLSPFLFDRSADVSVLSAGISQQIYGPFRIGFQTAYNLDTGQEISTDYFVEYSRRTYNIILRYNPVLELGSFSFRINDFNWTGSPGIFDNSGVRPVVQGVTQ